MDTGARDLGGGASRTRPPLLQCRAMSDWKQIQGRIRRAKAGADPLGRLAALYEKTRDAMVAFELAQLYEKSGQIVEAVRCYSAAAERFRRQSGRPRPKKLWHVSVLPSPHQSGPRRHRMYISRRLRLEQVWEPSPRWIPATQLRSRLRRDPSRLPRRREAQRRSPRHPAASVAGAGVSPSGA